MVVRDTSGNAKATHIDVRRIIKEAHFVTTVWHNTTTSNKDRRKAARVLRRLDRALREVKA
jgi:hypothetical protein